MNGADPFDDLIRAVLHDQPGPLVECFAAYAREQFSVNTSLQYKTWLYNRMRDAAAAGVTVGELLGISGG